MATDLSGLQRTPFFGQHVAAGARMVDFGGWAMPVQYAGILAEHRAVREQAGLFDVSHMGEFLVEGPGALAFLQRLTTNDVPALAVGQAHYTLALTDSGGIVDDLLVYRRGPDRFLVCVNAACIPADWQWFSSHHDPARDDCTLVNASGDFAQLAIQGRVAEALLQPLTGVDLSAIGTYRFAEGELLGAPTIIARTGYTGEDGFELFFHPDHADLFWTRVMQAGAPHGLVPVGLGARDTLRLEMKFCLYGNDITRDTTPLEARLGWITKLKAKDFIGKGALVAQQREGVPRRLVGFELLARGIARHGHPVLVDGEPCGEVTSGAHSPSLGKPIGLCYLPSSHADVGNTFEIEIRGRRLPAVVVETPFYKRDY